MCNFVLIRSWVNSNSAKGVIKLVGTVLQLMAWIREMTAMCLQILEPFIDLKL